MKNNRIYVMVGIVAVLSIGARMANVDPETSTVSPPSAVRAIEQSVAAPTTSTTSTTTTTTLSPATTTTTMPSSDTTVALRSAPAVENLSIESLPAVNMDASPPPQITETSTAVTTTTVPEVVVQAAEDPPTTTHAIPPYKYGPEKMCWEWLDLASEVGWPDEELSKLGYVMYRESRCDPMAWNQSDPTRDGSRGLTQINGYWCRPSRYYADGYIQTAAPGLLALSGTCADLHDPAINLRAALLIYQYGVERGNNPWTPWAV